jgi:hypothetical protein
MEDVMDRQRGQHGIQAVERDRCVSPKQKINGDLPILNQRLPSSIWTFDAPSPAECDALLSRNRSLSAAASTIERLACSRDRAARDPEHEHRHEVRRARDRFCAQRFFPKLRRTF